MIDKGDIKFLVLLLSICLGLRCLGQTISQSNLDSLGYEELLSEFNLHEGDSITQESIARTYLERARTERDTIKMARGYDRLARVFHPEKNIMYADSVINLTQEMDNITYPAMGYILKGFNFSLKRDVVGSNKNFIRAYQISKARNNIQQQVYVMDLLISDKLIWGSKTEALNLQYKRNHLIHDPDFIKGLNQTIRPEANIDVKQLYMYERINSTLSFVFCHLTLKNYDSTQIYIDKGYKLLNEYNWINKSHYYNWLNEVKLEMFSELGIHHEVDFLAELLFRESQNLSRHSLLNIFRHYGISKIKRGNTEEGYSFLMKSDSILKQDESLLLPSDRVLLVELKEYYKKKGEINKQIEYLNRLIRADSIMKINFKYFEPNVIRKFETPNLVEEKEILITELERQNSKTKRWFYMLMALLTVCFAGMIYYFFRQRIYKKRFDEIINKKANAQHTRSKGYSYEVSNEVINSILKRLDEFESSHEYLDEISLQSLSKRFETNPNYLSRVINLKIGKNFSQYINDLRIDYAMKYLFSDSKKRKYTIKALAEECGYKNAESFSKAFYKRNGIYPSYYLRQLEKGKG